MMTIKEKIEVLQAYKEGKKIEYRGVRDDDNFPWFETQNPLWNFEDYDYRVKPQPKLRPYNSAKEFLQEKKEHGDYISSHGQYMLPIFVTDKSVVFSDLTGPYLVSYEELFNQRKWADGSICGIMEETK